MRRTLFLQRHFTQEIVGRGRDTDDAPPAQVNFGS